MSLRIIFSGNTLPANFICDQSASFQPGQIMELTTIGNQIAGTVSNGLCPLGIIDDIKTKSFTNVSWNEIILVPAISVLNSNNQLVTPVDIKADLRRPNIVSKSFTSTVDVILNPINGTITFIAGTPLNVDLTGSGTPNGIRAIVNYTYAIANIPGDDSTLGNGRMTVWYQRAFFQTSIYETNREYPLRANLFVSEQGMLTTRKPSRLHPVVATVTAPPMAVGSPMLEFLWF